jgi:hypothetical protein
MTEPMLPRGQHRLPGFDAVDEGIDVDRDTWTTPQYLTDAIGSVDLDPCSNERSHVRAARTFRLDNGQDGLVLAKFVDHNHRVFINPPYSRGQVELWIRAYEHTRFVFLLRLDTSTQWFAQLMRRTETICVLKEKRLNFDPPPGASASSNAFPHALFYSRAADVTAEVARLCYRWSVIR